ncbi:hypothetical protein ERX46_15545 [Brumimicrobium glaciale]|uniref:Uncharacterized protein n=1 Tax=Brumimicrobium glaciale TaxID=200475 RepID=A0A4Q4KGC1_9FLAO|nr:hypothetical protein [Brumimicrobium glaciale]RYM32095.1 hypothetical protein ERX46_15545 [Brumimicrobium glaciale]
MKIKTFLPLCFILIFTSSHAQNFKDSIFENVIVIDDDNITQVGMNFLIDISIPTTIETPVLFISSQIPVDLLAKIYPEFAKIIVIVPNRTSSSCVAAKNETNQKPIKSTIVYEFIRSDRLIKKDSVILKNDYPKMNFAPKTEIQSDEFESYYTEYFGSICCPRDLQWDNTPTRDEFISFFEKENNVEIIETYRKVNGKEGEAIYYYTLNGLSNKMKLHFILERKFYRIINRHLKDIIFIPQVFTPIRVKMNSSMEKI